MSGERVATVFLHDIDCEVGAVVDDPNGDHYDLDLGPNPTPGRALDVAIKWAKDRGLTLCWVGIDFDVRRAAALPKEQSQ